MAPGLPAAWSARCAVCLLAAAGAALGPLGGSAHGAPPPDGPPPTASAPGASGPPGSAVPPAAAAPRPARPAPGSPSALPAGPLPPSAVPLVGTPEEWPVPSSAASSGHGPRGHGPRGDDAPGATPSPTASPQVSGSTAPLAGREAGAGKARPGRSLAPWEPAAARTPDGEDPSDGTGETGENHIDPVDLPAATPPPDAFTDPAQRAAAQALDAASLRRVQQVSLGMGITLVGLGIGFLAFRMRRAN
ncbi:hypothetical protein ACH4A3_08905 [Streptomyces sp. NPDC018007]|uniref:hypothetical protein n=1 Tax=Streptomyces sp. NPDC018007 TaxID=3365029 RepID=UPI0037A08BF0